MDLIIGAGISGLSYAAFTNERDYQILEKELEIGGYCKTIKRSGFVWDYSGHFFHFRNEDIKSLVLENMVSEELLEVQKQTQIYYNGDYIDFPFQKNIHQLNKEEFIECLYDLFNNEIVDDGSFKSMLYSKFGRSISEKFLVPYNEKLYACDLNDLDSDAMGRFFPHADRVDIIRNFKRSSSESYNSTFTYPRGGAIEYVRSIASRVDDSRVHLGEEVISIDIENKEAVTNKRTIKYDRIISTMPLPTLLNKVNMDYDKSAFSCNKVVVFNLGFSEKGRDTKNHWVYFPEKDYCFYRIGYYDNIFGDEKMSLYVEVGFEANIEVNKLELLEKVLEDLKKAGVLHQQELVDYAVVEMNPAYVHINNLMNTNKEAIQKKLRKANIFSIGRYGDWKYCSIEDNIIEAKNLINELKK